VTAPTTAAVIGCGAISAEHLAYLSCANGVDLVAVCDLSPSTARYTAQRYGAKRSYTDHREMLATEKPASVHVLTPPASHPRLVTEALEAGANVLCEKPLALDTETLVKLQAIAATRGLMLMESQNLRFNDQMFQLAEIVRSGRIGDVIDVEVRLALDVAGDGGKFSDPNVPSPVASLPGGVIHDFLPHLSYLMLHFLGYPEVEKVSASWSNISGIPQLRYDELDAIVRTTNGTGSIHFSSRVRPDKFRLILRGTVGSVETDFYHPYLKIEVPRSRQVLSPIVGHAANGLSLVGASIRNLRNKVLQHGTYHGLPRMLDAYYQSIATGTPAPIAPLEMERCSRLIDALVAEAVPA
jgi:predicted dehydrogenase